MTQVMAMIFIPSTCEVDGFISGSNLSDFLKLLTMDIDLIHWGTAAFPDDNAITKLQIMVAENHAANTTLVLIK